MQLFGIIGPILSAANTIFGVIGQLQQGRAYDSAAQAQIIAGQHAQAVANRQAEALEQQAGQERAVAQREAIVEKRQGRLVASRATALAAASGAGALDPTIIDILAGIETEAEFRSASALAAGEQRGRGLEYQGTLARAGGAFDRFAAESEAEQLRRRGRMSRIGAGATLLTGGLSLFDKYGPRSTPAASFPGASTGTYRAGSGYTSYG